MVVHSNKFCLVPRNVDVTGVTPVGEYIIPMQSAQLWRANISFATVGGNPFSVLQRDEDIDNGGDGDDGDDAASSSTDSFGLLSGDQHFTNKYCYILDAHSVKYCLLVGKTFENVTGTSYS